MEIKSNYRKNGMKHIINKKKNPPTKKYYEKGKKRSKKSFLPWWSKDYNILIKKLEISKVKIVEKVLIWEGYDTKRNPTFRASKKKIKIYNNDGQQQVTV